MKVIAEFNCQNDEAKIEKLSLSWNLRTDKNFQIKVFTDTKSAEELSSTLIFNFKNRLSINFHEKEVIIIGNMDSNIFDNFFKILKDYQIPSEKLERYKNFYKWFYIYRCDFKKSLNSSDVNEIVKLAKKCYEEKYYEAAYQLIKFALEKDQNNERIRIWMFMLLSSISPDEVRVFDYFPSIYNDSIFNFYESVNLLCYPAEEFNGSKALKIIRTNINDYKDGFIRVAANFIGVNLCPANHYILDTPYHRFSIEKAETYHRSAKNPLASLIGEAARKKDIKLSGTDISHLGHYHHPHIALGQYLKDNFLEKEPDKKAIEKVFGSGKLYDLLLQHKRKICKYIIKEYSKNEVCLNSNYLKPDFYYNYPCVMVFVGEDARFSKFLHGSPTRAATKAWANALISFFIALVHYYAKCAGLNIELTRRSSFGFLTPTIAPCGNSFRINVGLIPKQYADVLINSLKVLNEILKTINDLFEKFDTTLPDEVFFKDQHYKNYRKKKYKSPTNLLALIFFKAESKGKTTIQTLMKTALARDTLMCNFFNALCEPNKDINQTKTKASYFLSTLRDNFLKIKLIEQQNKYKLSYLQTQEPRLIPRDLAKFGLAKINDDCFWGVVSSLADLAEKELLFLPNTNVLLEDVKKAANRILIMIRKCIEKSNIVYQEYNHTELVIENNYLIEKSIFFDENLFFNLELLGELLFSQAVILDKETKEGYGSDSDIEEEKKEKLSAVWGQKIIVQNGMRAIIATMLVSANYLKTKSPKLFLQGAYYETECAVKLFKKFNKVSSIKDANIVLFDVNPCITDGKRFSANITKSAINNTKVLIADSTSATTNDHKKCIKQFRMSETAEVMFFVSSGLKNEQIGIDKNTYGTIRVFTKNKKSLEKIVGEIKKEEVPITSSIAHGFRRMLKRMGCVPTNASILKLDQTHTTQDLTLTSHYSPSF